MIEIIVYSIGEEKLETFHALKEQLIKEAMTIPGIISAITRPSAGSNNEFVDIMEWESSDAMDQGFEVFKTLPSSKAFMDMIVGPPAFVGKFNGTLGGND